MTYKPAVMRHQWRQCWGPLTPYQLIDLLAQAHNRQSDYASTWGLRPINSWLTAHKRLLVRYQQGLSLRLDLLPFDAKAAALQLQGQGIWAELPRWS